MSGMWNRLHTVFGDMVHRVSEQRPMVFVKEKVQKYEYKRPDFLKLDEKDYKSLINQTTRNVVKPKDSSQIPKQAGYAEVINGGKSELNEDQAAAELFYVCINKSAAKKEKHSQSKAVTNPDKMQAGEREKCDLLAVTYYAIFDGHAGPDCALIASKHLHNHIQEKITSIVPLMNMKINTDFKINLEHFHLGSTENITVDDLIIGVLQDSFQAMDEQIGHERRTFKITSGCAVIVAMFMMGKLFVANAGDCRAVLFNGEQIIQMSRDHTPFSEKKRIYSIAELHPEYLYHEFTCCEYTRRVHKCNLGQKILYKKPSMSGWGCKIAEEEDTYVPLISTTGKKSRLMETIGVARGFGDHDLKVYVDTSMRVKPFLTALPEVNVYNLCEDEVLENSALIMGSDGLWDVLTNEEAVNIVHQVFKKYNKDNFKRYAAAAEELLVTARGLPTATGWMKSGNQCGSFDDITVFVIPLHD